MENTTEPKRGIYQKFIRLVAGFFIGAFSMFPFASTENLKESLQIKEVYPRNLTLGQKIKKYLCSSWSLLIGMMLGAVFVFIIPFEYLVTNYTFTVHATVLAFSFGSCILPLYRILTIKGDKTKSKVQNNLPLLGYLLAGIVILCLVTYIRPDFLTYLRNSNEIVYLALLVMVGSFLSEFCGYSFGSLLYLGGIYLTYANKFYEIGYLINIKEKSTWMLLIVLAIAFLIGNFLGFILKNNKDRIRERSALALGLYFFGTIYCATTYIKPPYTTDVVDSEQAQYTIMAACIFGALMIALVLSFYGFRGLNKLEFFVQDTQEKDIMLRGLLTQGLLSKKPVEIEDDDIDISEEETEVAKEEVKEEIKEKQPAEPKKEDIKPKVENKEIKPKEEKKESNPSAGLDLDKLKALSKDLKK